MNYQFWRLFLALDERHLVACAWPARSRRIAAPYFIFNTLEFGHPLKTGYDLWVPAWSENSQLFSFRNVSPQLVMVWSEATANWDEFRVANLFGTGTLNVLLSKPFIAAPIDDLHNYCYSRLWHYGKAEAIRLVQSGLDHATPVYGLLLPSKHNDQDVPRLPSIQGYSCRRSEKSSTRAVIMTLTKNASAPTPDSASHQ